jgi:hypothetical protein
MVRKYLVSDLLSKLNITLGTPCDRDGNPLPSDAPPPPADHRTGYNDWFPYEDRAQFETADFFFRRNQMSAGDIDSLLKLWAGTLAKYDDTAPFKSHKDLYETIDATTLGDANWKSFSTTYTGVLPQRVIPSWMKATYDVWYRDPHDLIHNMLANPDFDAEFDCSPFQEYDKDGNHCFQDFMSSNWAWAQAVSQTNVHLYCSNTVLGYNCQ